MHAAFETSPPTKPASRSMQFSIKTLLSFTTAFAAIMAMIAIPPLAVFSLIAVYAVSITFCLVAAFSGRGWIRPFAIMAGAYLLATVFILINSHINGPEAAAILLLINFAIAWVVGFSGSAAQSILARRGGYIPVPRIPVLKNWLYNEPVEIKDPN